jgi:hypothetical protein
MPMQRTHDALFEEAWTSRFGAEPDWGPCFARSRTDAGSARKPSYAPATSTSKSESRSGSFAAT